MRYSTRFPLVEGAVEATAKRVPEVSDIVVRSGVLSPNRVVLRNYPISNPIAVFNPAVSTDGEYLKVYARIILGYYMYVSNIVEIAVPLEDVLKGYVNMNTYSGDIVVYPSTKYDIWGTEDPRVTVIDGEKYMVYTGRSINYFNPVFRKNRTLPVAAVYDKKRRVWVKKYVFTPLEEVFGEVVSDKDAFLYKAGDTAYLFHRPHLSDESYHLVVSRVELKGGGSGLTEITIDNAYTVLAVPDFESKIGWGTPPVPLNESGDRVVVFLHGVDMDEVVYRVFAAELRLRGEEIVVEAVTPRYIMEPRAPYEIVGDRPVVVFPCGAIRLDKEHILVTYGAADFVAAFGAVDMNALLAELDRGRVY